jgi:RNA recognition motif-containing protein
MYMMYSISRSSARHRDMPLECKVYVGDLPERTTERDIHEHFERCGPLKNVWVARNPPGFAFVEFNDPRDAEDAVRRLDGM